MIQTDYYGIAKEKMESRRYAKSTITAYLAAIYNFLKWVDVPPSRITSRHFGEYLKTRPWKSRSKQNTVISGLKFLFDSVLGRKYDTVDFKRPRKKKSLPRVIDNKVLMNKLDSIKSLKHKSMLKLIYSDALRAGELLNILIEDVDSDRMLIFLRNAKGNKDRYVPLSQSMLCLLRVYFKEYRPIDYLFNGDCPSKKYSYSSLLKLTKKYLGDSAKTHDLRHSSATHMLQEGTDLRIIQKILGHSSSKTTEIYTHVTSGILRQARQPC